TFPCASIPTFEKKPPPSPTALETYSGPCQFVPLNRAATTAFGRLMPPSTWAWFHITTPWEPRIAVERLPVSCCATELTFSLPVSITSTVPLRVEPVPVKRRANKESATP